MLTKQETCANISESLRDSDSYGRVVELVDSLDSGSSVHCGRAGSSPASPTRIKAHPFGCAFIFDLTAGKPAPAGTSVAVGYIG